MPPDSGSDPQVWLSAAREHLAAAGNDANPNRIRCFCSQRSVELSLKALLLHHGIDVPKVHTLERLVLLLPGDVPDAARQAVGLTTYAVEEMYPDTFTDVSDDHAVEAAEQARAVVRWVAGLIDPAKGAPTRSNTTGAE